MAFVIEELTKDVGDKQEITLQFLGAAIVGIVEWWFTNGKPYPPQVMAEQVGNLLETNL
ncbi:TetR-like C-terminal domain-containing protein [Lysinibacillus sp. FSL K6-0232]|uniref:TetR-like C-terminal domain-containing protein n=1 Tax=Lysinibacillus sp. FSL K6-0232 TaxID=2921425 RepID=UPI0040408B5D